MIKIVSPADGAVIRNPNQRFEGRVEPGATVFVGQEEVPVVDGTWCVVLFMGKVPTTVPVEFRAQDQSGNVDSDTVRVIYEPPQITTTSEPSP
ncbi:MAG: hypothetical protein ACRDXF_08130 [Acidimicrobiia bacterium]